MIAGDVAIARTVCGALGLTAAIEHDFSEGPC